jgi:hypothetical protein
MKKILALICLVFCCASCIDIGGGRGRHWREGDKPEAPKSAPADKSGKR